MTMSAAAAAREWLAVDPIYRDAKARREAAEDVLKAHFRKTGSSVYRGIAYAITHFRRLDSGLAKAALGAKHDACMVPASRETLSAVPR